MEEIRKLICEGRVEELKRLLSGNIIHVRDIKEIIYQIEDQDFCEFYRGEKTIEELDTGIRALERLLHNIDSEFHDFSDSEKTITLKRMNGYINGR